MQPRFSASLLVAGMLVLAGFSALVGFTLRGSGEERLQAAESFSVVPLSATSYKVLAGDSPYIGLDVLAWGPGWSWLDFQGSATNESGRTAIQAVARSGDAILTLSGSLVQRGTDTVILEVRISSNRDAELTGISLAVSPEGSRFAGGIARAGAREEPLPIERRGLGTDLGEFELIDANQRVTKFELDPVATVGSDGAIRIGLVGERIAANAPVERTITITLPDRGQLFADARQMPSDSDMGDWYEFRPSANLVPGDQDEVSMADWLEKPAGLHGRIVAEGDRLVVGGDPIKLWGINVCFADCAPPKELAERRAKFYARNGINAVRLHKYADGHGWAGIQSVGSFAEFDAAALDRMDYFVAKLKEEGIYVKLSPTFGVRLGHEDVASVPYLAEFGPVPRPGERLNTQHGSVFLSRELQELQINQTVKLLRHRNPYTGMTYADDPAVAIVELFNEDSALFYGTMARLQNVPTLRARAGRDFTDWLAGRYGSEAALLEAWGPNALNSFGAEGLVGESWAERTIVPAGNPWFYDPDQMVGSQAHKARRLHDTMLYFYEKQNEFYDRFVRAIREAGYEGEVLSSNWFAGRAYSHFYNLHSDARIGMVDRHNYWGGGGREFDDRSMLARPGSGILSLAHSQVAGRPFSVSEWIHVFPSEWGAEGPAIIGAYGMGLQGWDVSFIFQNRDDGRFSSRIGRDQWDVTAPQVLGMFPAVARQVLRGDVRESDLTIPRNVHIDSLHEGRLGFDDRSTAAGDFKTTDSNTVPIEAIAVGKSVVRFTDRFEETPRFDFQPYLDGALLRSSTRELAWSAAEGGSTKAGWFSIDTPGTQALVGFADGESADLTDVEIRSETQFAAIYVTARDRSGTIADGDTLLVTAMARARNSGMNIRGALLLGIGVEPILLEPVRAEIRLKRAGTPTVYVLDHDGRRTDRTVPVSDGVVRLDTGRDRAFSYLIVYP